MKQVEQTVFEMIQHFVNQHPNLAPLVEKLALKAQDKNKDDSDLFLTIYGDLLKKSKAQMRQDIFVLTELNFKRNGYFVEFGATNGIDASNTYLLEKEYNWQGILADAGAIWHNRLKTNRNVHIETKCVWRESNARLDFNETNTAEISTINSFSSCDSLSESRKNGKIYSVETISLIDLLKKYNAPKNIDYLSIDTEGSEFEILNSFDFDEFRFSVITCEHNFTPSREKVNSLLTRHGYIRKFENLSKWDDWYVSCHA